MFLDDDFSSTGAFRVSMGFTDNGTNFYQRVAGFFSIPFYIARPAPGGALRQWKEYDDPTLPTCPPNVVNRSAPAARSSTTARRSDPGNTPARCNDMEREVTPIDNFLLTQFGKGNGFEWYFSSARPGLDFSYGRDSSALVAEHARHGRPGDEGPLVLTQNADRRRAGDLHRRLERTHAASRSRSTPISRRSRHRR